MRSEKVSNDFGAHAPLSKPHAPVSKQVASLKRKLERHLSAPEKEITDEKVRETEIRIQNDLHKHSGTRVRLSDRNVAALHNPTQKIYEKIAHSLSH